MIDTNVDILDPFGRGSYPYVIRRYPVRFIFNALATAKQSKLFTLPELKKRVIIGIKFDIRTETSEANMLSLQTDLDNLEIVLNHNNIDLLPLEPENIDFHRYLAYNENSFVWGPAAGNIFGGIAGFIPVYYLVGPGGRIEVGLNPIAATIERIFCSLVLLMTDIN